ncbi:hypothetical protein [Pseudoxanthomonas sp. PXM02]|uniref:hypothetical protein n=1 Tax=Pseudoxanthomonas sp. PXM02 TaxID=2769294 RepID=UPI0017816B78|nr:hypothetical protein [Pseudoxanthomonas sp. PXM02]MBD9478982.1 hypothetical protein [Pseudoxanthomonas sp. PXM02]
MLSLPFAFLLSVAQVAPSAAQDCPNDLLQIDGVEIAAPVARLLKTYGAPNERRLLDGEHYEEEVVFDQITAYTISDRIEYLASSRSGSCTGRGICIGGNLDEAAGKFAGFVPDQDGQSLHCANSEAACSLVVQGAPNIEKLVLQCLP